MLRGLRRRLAFIFTAFTGLVLAGVLGVSLALGIQQRTRENQQWFYQTIDTLYLHVMNVGEQNEGAGGGVVMEQYPYVICINLNGKPLVGDGKFTVEEGWTPATDRQTLFKAVQATAEERGLTGWLNREFVLAATVNEEGSLAQDTAPLTPNMSDSSGLSAPAEVFEYDVGVTDGANWAEAQLAVDAAEPAEEGSQPAEDAASAEQQVLFPSISISTDTISGSDGVFEQAIDGVDYRAAYFEVPLSSYWMLSSTDGSGRANSKVFTQTNELYQVAVLEDLRPQKQGIVFLCLGYGLLFLAGLAGLFLANWLLAKLVLRPTAEGMQRQADFVAAASHELRSPLAVVRSSLSAARVAADEAEAERYTQAAENEAERMSRLVDDLLLLAGGDAKSWEIERCEVDLDTILIGSSEQYAPLAQKRQVALELQLPEETLPRVRGDADRLRQILGVLLDNALQYAPAGSSIELSAGTKKNRVWVQLADHGPGIPEAEQDKVFGRFYRADQSRGDKDHFGLGLSVARELAALHGGSLAVADTPGGGATFTLTLPAAEAGEDKKAHKNNRC